MFKHRLSKFCRASLFAVCLLFVGGSLQSCKDMLDDYRYDDSEPDWLGASIYAFLEEGTESHSYKNYLQLIDTLGEKTTLNHTGSRTLFVADDEAFERFFKDGNNKWGVTCIEDMTIPQMKTILYSSMLDNAMLLDMMANTSSDVSDEGKCLRRTTSFEAINDVPVVNGEYFEHHAKWPTYNIYWDELRGSGRTEDMKLLMDQGKPMMVHFLGDYIRTNNLEISDINFLFQKKKDGKGKEYKEGDAFIFDNKVVDGEVNTGEYSEDVMTIACKNGYLYRMDDVLLPPTNMAGELRVHKDTKIFSHLLDRFCVPEFYKIEENGDSLFALRYFTKEYTSHALLKDGKNPLSDELLNYDPGKNEYSGGLGKLEDMGAMFVPKDECLYEYFAGKEGLGKFLIDYFAPNANLSTEYAEENIPALLAALDSVPQVNIASFVNNLMKPSFVNSVPSRFFKVTNDANDEMGIKEEFIDECLIANNGVVYLMNKVFGPAAYDAVSAPTTIHDNLSIMRTIIKQLRYDYYLLAMDADYSFIVPVNDYFVYYDPVTFANPSTIKKKAYSLHYDNKRPDNKTKAVEFWADVYNVNENTLLVDSTDIPTNFGIGGNGFTKNRMADVLDYLIIVHEKDQKLRADKKYYRTKGYGTIKVDATDPNCVKFYGGEQLELCQKLQKDIYVASNNSELKVNGYTYTTSIPEELKSEINIPGGETSGEGEGGNEGVAGGENAFRASESGTGGAESGTEGEGEKEVDENAGKLFYSAIPTPPRNSVYKNMSAHAKNADDIYHHFYNLCNLADVDGDGTRINLENSLMKMFGLKAGDMTVKDSIRLYSIFYSLDNNNEKSSYSVPFFNTFHYTVYVPSNAAIDEMLAKGLPTWGEIEEIADKEPGRAASMLRLLNNFVRYHFQDNSVYYDECAFSVPAPGGGSNYEASYSTAVINSETGRFYENTVKSDAGNTTIVVTDNLGYEARIVNTPKENENITWNVMCRDIIWNGNDIVTSSYAVIQPIDRALQNGDMFGYEGDRFKRFASNGCLVDTMKVAGGTDGFDAMKFGEDCYLVAKLGRTAVSVADTTYYYNTGYIMEKLPEMERTLTKEETFVLKNEKPMHITSDGYLLKVVPAKEKGKPDTIEFDTVTRGGKKYLQKVSNNGDITEVEFDTVFVPADKGDASDNNSDVE